MFRENCYNIAEQSCKTIEKEMKRDECKEVVEPPACKTITEQNCFYVTKNTCAGENPSNVLLPGYNGDQVDAVPATICSMVEKEVCETVEKLMPKNVTNTQCETVPVENCSIVKK